VRQRGTIPWRQPKGIKKLLNRLKNNGNEFKIDFDNKKRRMAKNILHNVHLGLQLNGFCAGKGERQSG
jgi:hypothetical protein